MKLCQKRRETGVLCNTLLSSLASFETPTPALSSVSAPRCQPKAELSCCRGRSREIRFSGNWLGASGGACRQVCPVAMSHSHLRHWNGTFFENEAIQKSQEAFGLPCSPLSDLTWAARTESFSSTVGLILGSKSHLFQYLVDDKSDSWKLSNMRSWAGFHTNCGRNQDNLSPYKRDYEGH